MTKSKMTKSKMNENKGSMKNVFYILKMIHEASRSRIIISLLRTTTEQVFYVFFFVYLTQYIYTAIETNIPYKNILIMVGVACGLHIGIHFLAAWYTYYSSKNDPRIYKHIFDKIIKKSKEIPLASFEKPDFYDKFSRALDESVDRAFGAMSTMSFLVAGVIAAIGNMLLIVQVDAFLLIFTIFPVISSVITGKQLSKLWYEMEQDLTRNNRVIGYTKRVFYEKKYASEIRLYNIRELLFKKHRDAFYENYKIEIKYRKKIVAYSIINILCFRLLMLSGSIVYIIYCVTKKDALLIAPYIAMINGVSSMSGNIERAIWSFIDLLKQGALIQNLRDFLEFKEKKVAIDFVPITNSIDDIVLNNVSFIYEGSDKPVINNLSLHIHKGEKIAFVGHNGAGKTTIVKLIMGLYPATNGEIIAGGTNISSYDNSEYHKHFGVVFQDFQIFALSLAENVLMKVPENEEERNIVIDALNKAQFTQKLETTPLGIDSMVTKEFSDEGIGLSGGEAQKIAIARVFAKKCDVAILDEPSSALDPIAEFNMYNNMMEAAQNKTVIFISHRLSSARMADRIYILENGEIIEQGTHNELMSLDKKYAEMFHLQAQNYIDQEVMENG